MRERYGVGSGYRPPGLSPSWRCALCGCSVEEALQRRERAGLTPLAAGVRTCTPECRRAAREAKKDADY